MMAEAAANGVVVHPATERDIDAVVELASGTVGAAHWRRPEFVNCLQEDKAGLLHKLLLVATVNGATVGFAAASWLYGDEAGELLNLGIAENARRRGFARQLCAGVRKWVSDFEVQALALEVRVSNEGAIRLYKRIGFVEVGRRAKYYADPVEDALLMRWSFAQPM